MSAAPQPEPATDGRPDFSLSNDELSVESPRDPEAGCPSSRCIPRDAIPWQTMAPWDAWEALLQRARAEEPMLGSMLSRAGLIELGVAGAIRVAAPATGVTQGWLRDNPELKVLFEQLTVESFGEPMRLELVDAAPSLPDLPSLELVETERKRQHVEAIEQDALAHPRIRAVLHAFAGRVESTMPLVELQLPPAGQRGLPA